MDWDNARRVREPIAWILLIIATVGIALGIWTLAGLPGGPSIGDGGVVDRALLAMNYFSEVYVAILPILAVLLVTFAGGLTKRAGRLITAAAGVQALAVGLGVISLVIESQSGSQPAGPVRRPARCPRPPRSVTGPTSARAQASRLWRRVSFSAWPSCAHLRCAQLPADCRLLGDPNPGARGGTGRRAPWCRPWRSACHLRPRPMKRQRAGSLDGQRQPEQLEQPRHILRRGDRQDLAVTVQRLE